MEAFSNDPVEETGETNPLAKYFSTRGNTSSTSKEAATPTPSPPVNKKILEAFSNDPVEETGETNPLAKYFSTRGNTSSTSKEAATPTPSPSVNKKIFEAFSNDPVEATGETNPLAKYFSTRGNTSSTLKEADTPTPSPSVNKKILEAFSNDPVEETGETIPLAKYFSTRGNTSSTSKEAATPTPSPSVNKKILEAFSNDPVEATGVTNPLAKYFSTPAPEVKTTVKVEKFVEVKAPTSTLPPDEYVVEQVVENLVQAVVEVGPTSPTSTPSPDENILRSVAKDLVQAAIETSKEELISEQISRFDSSASQVKKFVEVQALLLKTSTSTVPPDEYTLRAVAKDLVQANIKASQVDLFSEVTLLDSSSSDQPCKNKMSNNQHSSAHEFFDSFGSSDSGTAPFHRVDHSFFTPNKNQTSFTALPPTSNAAEQRFVSPATNAQNFEPANLSAYAHPRQNVGDHAMSMQEPSYGAQERYSTAQLFSEAGASTTKETPHAKQLSDAENHATLTPPSYGSNLPEQSSAHTGNDLFNVAKSSTPGGGTSQLFSGQHQNDPFKGFSSSQEESRRFPSFVAGDGVPGFSINTDAQHSFQHTEASEKEPKVGKWPFDHSESAASQVEPPSSRDQNTYHASSAQNLHAPPSSSTFPDFDQKNYSLGDTATVSSDSAMAFSGIPRPNTVLGNQSKTSGETLPGQDVETYYPIGKQPVELASNLYTTERNAFPAVQSTTSGLYPPAMVNDAIDQAAGPSSQSVTPAFYPPGLTTSKPVGQSGSLYPPGMDLGESSKFPPSNIKRDVNSAHLPPPSLEMMNTTNNNVGERLSPGHNLFPATKPAAPSQGFFMADGQKFLAQNQIHLFSHAGAWTSTEDLAENQSAAQNSIPTSSSYAPMAGYPGETQSAQRKLASSLTSDNAVNSEASQPGFSINNEENNQALRSDVVQPDTPQLGPSSMVPFTSKEQLPSNHQTAWQPATQPFDSQASSDDVKAEPTQWDAIDPHGTPRNTQQASTLQQTSGPVNVGEKSSGIFYTHPSSNDQSAQFGNHGAGTIGSANLESSLANLDTITARDDESRDGNSLSGHQQVPAFGHERVNSLNTSDPKLDTPPANTSTIISNDDLTSGNQQALSSQHLGASVTMFPVGMTPQNTNKASIASTETRGSQQLDTVDPNQHPSAFMPVKPNSRAPKTTKKEFGT
ncbi:mucin-17-like [Dendronephthya gigantea]|uniref:mucin-17-like n=1 Tax=Dendronephthya gigantea TaxID=151771 RepID=UPI0010690226|nr:mucin-17-like [Dendronephthya gigantea]